MMELSEKEKWIYLAGLVDGEGCFGIYYAHPAESRHPYPKLYVVNTNKDVLDWIVSFLKSVGVTAKVYAHQVKGNRKQCYTCTMHKKADVHIICVMLRPFVIIKAKHIELMLRFFRASDKLDVECIIKEIRRLNKRGC